ncbi:SAM-dependent DNA methyltransferase [Klebsiella oxytoca]|uniref:type I restriction-modification system subunit M n=1 Tax=Enterobacteriaceae TaxID=543 RepID=UPI0010CB7A85|nr:MULTISPECIES: class I SAM-dependent DNA methyltransferase [Enterobacteriaceae]EFG3630317.1 SAM-dependent DNA methyltransferase [Escherichia coli]MBG2576792.1 SAM-dependent DNA methyltransferase [Klebsiella oxytoca]QRT52612.1 SAM-dependent DNA methyltransferase [Klebsiella oxytoca]WPI66032.1 class I SAM-dependent DNA methyltransferase [Klebsiella oxytoca]GDD25622.1 type I restriction-modification enzyme M subunit [Escherichia coli]
MTNFSSMAAFLWSVADLLRGDFKQSQYGRVILPFTVLRRLECVLTPTKQAVLDKLPVVEKLDENAADAILRHASGQHFYNTSPLELSKLGETQPRLNLERYIRSFSHDAREIFEHFKFYEFIQQLDDANLLYKVAKKFAEADLSPSSVSNHDMGLIFEDLIRRFAESSNETAGEHFTPRDIVRLTTSLVFADDDAALTKPGLIRRIYDPTAGTGGFLSSGMEYLHGINPSASLRAYGQELNPESYAICKADMLIKGQDISNIKLGNTLSDDQLWNERFDYCLSNPPFGVDWKKIDTVIRKEHKKGYDGRFGPGLPRVSDGSLLFLLHLISKMNDNSRIGIILNGSPLFTGGAGSGESEIRRFVLEQDLLDAIVALPTDMFYNTGIATYIWVLSNHKPKERKGKVLLINATEQFAPMRKSLGSKRKELTEGQIDEIVNQYTRYQPSANVKLFKTSDFGYRRITVERPLKLAFFPRDPARREALLADKDWSKHGAPDLLTALDAMDDKYLNREKFKKALPKVSSVQFKLLIKHLSETDENADVCKTKGRPEADTNLRDYENVPLSESVETYFAREVLPHVPDAWIDIEKTDPYDGQIGLVGYEIPFNRHFYQYQPPRSLAEIDQEMDEVSRELMALLVEVHS